jgi:hypothetical protein
MRLADAEVVEQREQVAVGLQDDVIEASAPPPTIPILLVMTTISVRRFRTCGPVRSCVIHERLGADVS